VIKIDDKDSKLPGRVQNRFKIKERARKRERD